MSLTEVLCDQCGESASWIQVHVPNPDRGWCKECGQEVGRKMLPYFFCSSGCMKTWVDEYHSSASKVIKNE